MVFTASDVRWLLYRLSDFNCGSLLSSSGNFLRWPKLKSNSIGFLHPLSLRAKKVVATENIWSGVMEFIVVSHPRSRIVCCGALCLPKNDPVYAHKLWIHDCTGHCNSYGILRSLKFIERSWSQTYRNALQVLLRWAISLNDTCCKTLCVISGDPWDNGAKYPAFSIICACWAISCSVGCLRCCAACTTLACSSFSRITSGSIACVCCTNNNATSVSIFTPTTCTRINQFIFVSPTKRQPH